MISRMLLQQKAVPEGIESFNFSDSAYVGEGYLNGAVTDLVQDICECDMQFMIADTIGTSKVIMEGAAPQALLENVITDGLTKLKSVWIKFLAKIKEYYKKVIDFFKAMFLSGKKFVDKFGKELQEKAGSAESFRYTGYEYNLSKGNAAVDNVVSTIETKIKDKLIAGFDLRATQDLSVTELKAKLSGGTEPANTSEFTESLIKQTSMKQTNVSDMKDELLKIYRGGRSEKAENLTLNKNQVKAMCDQISESKDKISQFERDYKSFETNVNLIITKLGKINAEDDKDAYAKASATSSYLTAACTVMKTACNVRVDIYREATKANTSVLKALYRYKPAKEGYLFESADEDIVPEMETDLIDAEDDLKEMEAACADCDAISTDNNKSSSFEGATLFEQAAAYLL